MDKIRINLQEFLLSISNAVDLVSPKLSNHHHQVAYLSFRLAQELNLPESHIKNVFFAALVHDIGALSINERLEIAENEPFNVDSHAFKGARLLEEFKPLAYEAEIIKYHHLPWDDGRGTIYAGHKVPYESHILHLADRICLRLPQSVHILSSIPEVVSHISKDRSTLFEPDCVDALVRLSKKEYIWLDLISRSPVDMLPKDIFNTISLEIDDLIDLASIFSHIIDFRSRFTACHSAGVANTARRLAELADFSPYECKVMLIAGYLHDLGKLAIDNSILEKPSKLNAEEFDEIRSHTYYTYHLLDAIPQFDRIKIWASYHHEKLNGTGYPFHIQGDNMPLGSRIMAVADIFTAITENRPYRKGMEDVRVVNILKTMVDNGSLDGKITGLLLDHFHEINSCREEAQEKASIQYENFLPSNSSVDIYQHENAVNTIS